MRKVGIKVETFVGAGRYQHEVICLGDYRRSCRIPEEVVEMQKKLNERLWEHIPDGSDRLVSEINYREPAPSLTSRAICFLTRRINLSYNKV